MSWPVVATASLLDNYTELRVLKFDPSEVVCAFMTSLAGL